MLILAAVTGNKNGFGVPVGAPPRTLIGVNIVAISDM